MIPTVNVNLTQCSCGLTPTYRNESAAHRTSSGTLCPGAPILIACRIPRSVVFNVVLGECTCEGPQDSGGDRYRPEIVRHAALCPASPVKVACSISGKTWEESEVTDYELRENVLAPVEAMLTASRDRWALVKALVLGQHGCCAQHMPDPLREQRNAVFSALADMARGEAISATAQQALDGMIAPSIQCNMGLSRLQPRPEIRPSALWLAAYVEHLIERVGVLP